MTTHTPVRRDTFTTHWKPRTPRAGNLASVNRCMSRPEALQRRHIQLNRETFRNIIVLDLDRTDGMGLADAFAMVGEGIIPAFNWAAESKSGGAHLAYVLESGVAWTARSREAPRRYFEDVRAALTEAAGADAAYRNYMTYNPLHPGTEARWLREEPWTLADLHKSLRPNGEPLMAAKPTTETTTENAGESRHQALFDELRRYAYTQWAQHYEDAESSGRGRLTHEAAVIAEGLRLNELNNPVLPLPENEVVSLAKSVARWTWTRFRKDSKSETQKAASMRAEAVRTRAERIGELRALHAQGQKLTTAFIRERYGVSKPTALSYLSQLGMSPQKRPADLDDRVADLYGDGETIAAIMRATGATRDQVRYSIKRQGLGR